MKINNNSLDQVSTSQLGKSHEASGISSGDRNGAAGARNDRDRVDLSNLSGQLLSAAYADSPGRAARIESLAADYRSGRYTVDSAAVSHAIVSSSIRYDS